MTAAGARLAFGADPPPPCMLRCPNMYAASTRSSALDASAGTNVPDFVLPLEESIEHGTRDSAYTCGAEHEIGRLAAGLYADFVVLDTEIFAAENPAVLLDTEFMRTVMAGRCVYEKEAEGRCRRERPASKQEVWLLPAVTQQRMPLITQKTLLPA